MARSYCLEREDGIDYPQPSLHSFPGSVATFSDYFGRSRTGILSRNLWAQEKEEEEGYMAKHPAKRGWGWVGVGGGGGRLCGSMRDASYAEDESWRTVARESFSECARAGGGGGGGGGGTGTSRPGNR